VLWTKAQAENTIAAYEQYRQESKLKYHESEAHTLIEQLRNTQHTLVNEAKLIVVGNGRVGKTSLTKVLVGDEPFDPQENSTHGIRIKKWTTAIPNGQKLILNIWDFGGQERYHNTHSFFLTKRALYLLVWDKETQKDAQTNTNLPDPEAQNFEYEYWLNVIKLKGGNSPVLMVQNKIERDKKQLQLEDSIEQFDNILDIEAVSAATGENVEDLRKNILKQYQSAEPLHNLISFTMPPNWRNVQELLEKRGKTEAYIPIDVYHELCAEEKIADADALATYLNDIGSVLYFPDGDRLSEILILNPIWATEVIYKIMNGLVKASGGYFTYEDLKTTPVADNKVYNAEGFSFKDNTEKRIFLELMLRFDICFELKKAEDLPPNKKTYLVPQYLSTKKHPAVQQWPKQGLRRSGYRYTFLPRSVIARVIARLGKMSSAENWWRDGLIIEDQGTKAKIEADYSRDCIRIEVQGKEMKELEARIHKEHFNEINLQMQASAVRFCPHCDTMIDEKWIQERPDQSIDRFDCLNPTCRKGITISSLYPTEMETKPRIFISYAREDANYKEQLDKSLRQLEWEGELEIWDDSQLIGGDQWYKVIKRELTEANIIIFLLSVDFLTSKFIRKEEISTAFERYAKEEVMIIPVIVRDCLWQSSPLEQFTILPVDAKPVNTYSNADEAWLQITKKIRETLVKQFNWGKKP
jgi:internalin A